MQVEWLPQAERNRDDQLHDIDASNPQAALDLGDRIMLGARPVADHSHCGRSGRIGRTRKLVVAGTPYVVIYRVETAAVLILRVLHGA